MPEHTHTQKSTEIYTTQAQAQAHKDRLQALNSYIHNQPITKHSQKEMEMNESELAMHGTNAMYTRARLLCVIQSDTISHWDMHVSFFFCFCQQDGWNCRSSAATNVFI